MSLFVEHIKGILQMSVEVVEPSDGIQYEVVSVWNLQALYTFSDVLFPILVLRFRLVATFIDTRYPRFLESRL